MPTSVVLSGCLTSDFSFGRVMNVVCLAHARRTRNSDGSAGGNGGDFPRPLEQVEEARMWGHFDTMSAGACCLDRINCLRLAFIRTLSEMDQYSPLSSVQDENPSQF